MPITPRNTMVRTSSGGVMPKRWVTRHGTVTKLADPKWRKLASEIALVRTGGDGDKAFEACVRLSNRGWAGANAAKRASGFVVSCMFGKNPRAALSSALARASRQLQKRSGAFAALEGYSKHNRRSRRVSRRSKRR